MSVLAAAVVPTGARPPAPGGGGGRPGWGGEAPRGHWEDESVGRRSFGPPRQPPGPQSGCDSALRPAPAASVTLGDLGSFSFPLIELRANRFGAGAPGRTHPRSVELCSPSAAEYRRFFFFFLHNSFPALSLSSLSSTLLPLSAPMPEHYLPQSSLCRFLEQVQLLPASPSPPSTRKGEKASVQLPVRAAAAANCASAQLREDPRLLETRGLREWASLLFFPLVCFVLFFSFFLFFSFGKLKCFGGFC